MNPAIMLAIDIAPASLARLKAQFTVHQATTPDARMAVARQHGADIRAIVTNGTTGLTKDLMDQFPALGIICAQGVGHEGIDLPAARARGIIVTNGPGMNADCVADHTLAITLALLRDIPANDAVVRAGGWRSGATMRPQASGKRVGIIGVGDIGMRIARRCEAFGMSVAYHNRTQRADIGYPYLPAPLALAEASDILMLVLPGGGATRHIIGAAELAALGPQGFLVNVGRGTNVDTAALIDALRTGGIAGAALDVIDGEPEVPAELRALPNVVFTPHMAGRSPESVAATVGLVIENLTAFFRGAPPPTPIP